tara:strand:+ start:948 stop:1259 length:312 start_codon:yes stop_codon:yes gene_type:complete
MNKKGFITLPLIFGTNPYLIGIAALFIAILLFGSTLLLWIIGTNIFVLMGGITIVLTLLMMFKGKITVPMMVIFGIGIALILAGKGIPSLENISFQSLGIIRA